MKINRWTGVGRVGRDPETKAGGALVVWSIACDDNRKDPATGEWTKDRTHWIPCKAFGDLADRVRQRMNKGDLVYIEGKLEQRSWEDNGAKRTAHEIKAYTVQWLPTGKPQAQRPPATEKPWAYDRKTSSTDPKPPSPHGGATGAKKQYDDDEIPW